MRESNKMRALFYLFTSIPFCSESFFFKLNVVTSFVPFFVRGSSLPPHYFLPRTYYKGRCVVTETFHSSLESDDGAVVVQLCRTHKETQEKKKTGDHESNKGAYSSKPPPNVVPLSISLSRPSLPPPAPHNTPTSRWRSRRITPNRGPSWSPRRPPRSVPG